MSAGVEGPSVGVPDESEVDEPPQVDGCCPGGEGDPVAFNASIFDSAVSVGDDPCNGLFDHGSILSILVEVVSVSPSGPGLGEELVVLTDAKDPANNGCRATVPHWTVPASAPKRAWLLALITTVCAFGQVTVLA